MTEWQLVERDHWSKEKERNLHEHDHHERQCCEASERELYQSEVREHRIKEREERLKEKHEKEIRDHDM